jgi:hypothetical protein
LKKFIKYFKESKQKYVRLKITNETKEKIYKFAKKIIIEKEYIYRIDNGSELKRWITGISGELAVEKFLDIKFFDWSIGNSNCYNLTDLNSIGLNIGVKTVEFGKFPIVHKSPTKPEIILVKDGDYLYLLGIASIEVMKKYSDDDLILSSQLKARNVKTGFYGFEYLQQFRNIKDLKEILLQYSFLL